MSGRHLRHGPQCHQVLATIGINVLGIAMGVADQRRSVPKIPVISQCVVLASGIYGCGGEEIGAAMGVY